MVVIAAAGCSGPAEMPELLPTEVRGWKAEPPDGLYDADTLYEYIDGGAEVYRALNVRRVLGRRYLSPEGPEIIADLFDMGSARDAFGAYHHDLREGEPAGIGRESEYLEGSLAFWKGPYFVSIIALGESEEARAAVLELGQDIAGRIREEGEPPVLLGLLPEKGILPGHTRYFHNHESLGRHLPLPGDNPLELDERSEGLLARYVPVARSGGETPAATLLLVRFPEAGAARRAGETLADLLVRGTGPEEVGQSEGGSWTATRAEGKTLIAVLGAASSEEADRLLEETLERLAREGR
jgi:hypothetical protein